MKKIIPYLILFLLINCNLKKDINYHGIRNLDSKQKLVIIDTTNKNDVIKILGPPSTTSYFDGDIWFYFEKKTVKPKLFTTKKYITEVNNSAVLVFNNRGILIDKEFFDLNDVNKLKFSNNSTQGIYSKRSFIYNFLSSMRQKINDPLNQRKKPSQQ